MGPRVPSTKSKNILRKIHNNTSPTEGEKNSKNALIAYQMPDPVLSTLVMNSFNLPSGTLIPPHPPSIDSPHSLRSLLSGLCPPSCTHLPAPSLATLASLILFLFPFLRWLFSLPRKSCSWMPSCLALIYLSGINSNATFTEGSPSPFLPKLSPITLSHLIRSEYLPPSVIITLISLSAYLFYLPFCEPQESRDIAYYWIPRTSKPDLLCWSEFVGELVFSVQNLF